MGLIDEVSHALVAHYRKNRDPEVSWRGPEMVYGAGGADGECRAAAEEFVVEFPNVAIYRGDAKLDEWLNGSTEGIHASRGGAGRADAAVAGESEPRVQAVQRAV